MIRALFMAIAAVCALATLADAEPVHVFAPDAAMSCGKWLDVRKQSNQKSWQAEAWMTGYLSGVAVGSRRDFWQITDEASLLHWIDKYCRESPMSSPTAGVKTLSDEIQRKK